MNYNKIYDNLVIKAKNRKLDEYSETHHIVPRCLGGSNMFDNLVELTPEEHYLAHLLLVKIFPDNAKLVYAAHKMCQGRNNKLYGWLRRKHAKFIGENNKKIGSDNSQFGTIWITDGVKTKKHNYSEDIPYGWSKGRTFSSETKANLAWAKGVKRGESSDEHKLKISLSLRKPDINVKLTGNRKHRINITDGVNNKHLDITESIPEGWYGGITKKDSVPPTIAR